MKYPEERFFYAAGLGIVNSQDSHSLLLNRGRWLAQGRGREEADVPEILVRHGPYFGHPQFEFQVLLHASANLLEETARVGRGLDRKSAVPFVIRKIGRASCRERV